MGQSSKIAGVVVWYRPQQQFVDNLQTYSNHLHHTWIIDNSECDNSSLVPKSSNFSYVPLGKNHGIAKALNLGLHEAEAAGFEYVLTMDQDSSFPKNDIADYLQSGMSIFQSADVALIGPGLTDIRSKATYESNVTITSGSLLRISAWAKVGGFNEKLFIDQVDHEFCYRLRREGVRIVINPAVAMGHQVGTPVQKTILGKRVSSTNHNWVRRYYHVRNSLYLRKYFAEFSKPVSHYLKDILVTIAGIILLEDGKMKKIWAMLQGGIDYYRGRYGAWEDIHRKSSAVEIKSGKDR